MKKEQNRYLKSVNQRVLGSSPQGEAKKIKELQQCNSFFVLPITL